MSKYILSIDAGTTSERAIIFDKSGHIVGLSQIEFQQFFPKPGWVEHDAEEIWTTQKKTITDVLKKYEIKPSKQTEQKVKGNQNKVKITLKSKVTCKC